MSTLAGIGVLVTRPESQAGPLARHLTALGATVFCLPALTIAPTEDATLAARCSEFGPLDQFDWVVFISANAVRHGRRLLPTVNCPRLVAVGPATAAALAHAGYPISLVPAHGYDSEHLLSTSELQNVSGQRILVIRGGAGRDLLAESLRARGATVCFADVYTRVRTTPAPGVIEAVETAWAAGQIHVVTVTSTDIARALMETLSPRGRALFARTAMLAGSTRIADTARQLGLAGPLIVAAAPHDEGLITALLATPREHLQPKASA
jgi:uroporphyrinogen-III synthase